MGKYTVMNYTHLYIYYHDFFRRSTAKTLFENEFAIFFKFYGKYQTFGEITKIK